MRNSRRDFVKQAAFGTAALLAYPPSRVLGANDRVRVGMIGVGGRGKELLKQVLEVRNAELVVRGAHGESGLPEKTAHYARGSESGESGTLTGGRKQPNCRQRLGAQPTT